MFAEKVDFFIYIYYEYALKFLSIIHMFIRCNYNIKYILKKCWFWSYHSIIIQFSLLVFWICKFLKKTKYSIHRKSLYDWWDDNDGCRFFLTYLLYMYNWVINDLFCTKEFFFRKLPRFFISVQQRRLIIWIWKFP